VEGIRKSSTGLEKWISKLPLQTCSGNKKLYREGETIVMGSLPSGKRKTLSFTGKLKECLRRAH